MSAFKILEYGERADSLYGIENKEITELELEALLEGKRLWTDINWEYAMTIRLKDRLNELDIDRENRELKSQLQQKENIIKEVREYIENLRDDDEYAEALDFSYEDRDKLLEILDKENKQ